MGDAGGPGERGRVGIAGKHDANAVRVVGLDPAEQFGAVDARHSHIGHHDVSRPRAHLFKRALGVEHEAHLPGVALPTQRVTEPVEDLLLVVDEQHVGACRRRRDVAHRRRPCDKCS